MRLTVAFKSEWQISVENGILKVHLQTLRAGGIPAGLLKSTILGFITGAVNDQSITSQGDVVSVDLNQLLHKRGVPATVILDSVACAKGELVIHCSEAEISLSQ